jgi:hypothetical protein
MRGEKGGKWTGIDNEAVPTGFEAVQFRYIDLILVI